MNIQTTFFVQVHDVLPLQCLKKNLNASKLSERPPDGEDLSKRFGGEHNIKL